MIYKDMLNQSFSISLSFLRRESFETFTKLKKKDKNSADHGRSIILDYFFRNQFENFGFCDFVIIPNAL